VELPEHWLWNNGSQEPGPAVLFDLDGVLANATARQHLLESSPPNWRAFFDAASEDTLIESSAALLDAIDPSLCVILLTGRPIRIREATTKWLNTHELRWDLLIMRNFGNYSKAREFKRETVQMLHKDGWELRLAFEDDAMICEMFEEQGVPCVYVHSGYYEQREVRFPSDAEAAGDD
jgi:hypothetical protein